MHLSTQLAGTKIRSHAMRLTVYCVQGGTAEARWRFRLQLALGLHAQATSLAVASAAAEQAAGNYKVCPARSQSRSPKSCGNRHLAYSTYVVVQRDTGPIGLWISSGL